MQFYGVIQDNVVGRWTHYGSEKSFGRVKCVQQSLNNSFSVGLALKSLSFYPLANQSCILWCPSGGLMTVEITDLLLFPHLQFCYILTSVMNRAPNNFFWYIALTKHCAEACLLFSSCVFLSHSLPSFKICKWCFTMTEVSAFPFLFLVEPFLLGLMELILCCIIPLLLWLRYFYCSTRH